MTIFESMIYKLMKVKISNNFFGVFFIVTRPIKIKITLKGIICVYSISGFLNV